MLSGLFASYCLQKCKHCVLKTIQKTPNNAAVNAGLANNAPGGRDLDESTNGTTASLPVALLQVAVVPMSQLLAT